ncbi:hypothetical protein HNR11_000035 [Nesterenkonia sandarakina]|uniref:Uncharacterized protein n=1 Tax=Nesterenkonia sandarakina TaxID=272918 RepID=A0A7Z0J208_9MICC|nr:hypothetical protein [Nesterenkonia sandarakina]
MNDPAPARTETLSSSLATVVPDIPGVSRLVPSFRDVLASATKQFFGADGSDAAVVDVVARDGEVLVYIDLYIDGSRPAGDVVNAVHGCVFALVTAEQRAATQVEVRILGVGTSNP